MKLIPLTQGKFAIVDDEDYLSMVKYRWCAQKNWNTFYAVRRSWERKWKRYKFIRMHCEILGIKGVDHKNRNGLDNRKENLRLATHSQQKMNCVPSRGRRFKGTQPTRGEERLPWRAKITINRKCIYLGQFKTEEEAAKAYDVKAKDVFGEFARTNF